MDTDALDDIKLCRDCKHRGNFWLMPGSLQYCYQPDVVKDEWRNHPGRDGKRFADHARTYGPCGRDGKFWERWKFGERWKFWER